jgi:orotidine-5'-phosphate decarboxylase
VSSFGERLAVAVAAHGPLCVGIDPHPGLLAEWGLADDARGLERFALTCVDAFAGHVAVVKPQSAFFERHGAAGIAVLEKVLAGLAAQVPPGVPATLSLLDVKRGDIGSTMDGYADAYLAVGAPLGADAVTLSPYLGFGSLASAIRTADDAGRGVFVLARTSNPEGGDVQLADRAGRSVAQAVVDAAAAANRDALAAAAAREQQETGAVELGGLPALGPVGVVVGATGDHELDLSALSGAVLAPGLGAQGATPADLVARFAGVRGVVLPAASRSVLRAGPGVAALRAAAVALRDELAVTDPATTRPPRTPCREAAPRRIMPH